MSDAMVSSEIVYFKKFPKLLLKNSFLRVIQLEWVRRLSFTFYTLWVLFVCFTLLLFAGISVNKKTNNRLWCWKREACPVVNKTFHTGEK